MSEFPPDLILRCEKEAAKLGITGATLGCVVEVVLRASGHKALVENLYVAAGVLDVVGYPKHAAEARAALKLAGEE